MTKTAFVIEGKLSLWQSQITQNRVNESNLKVSDADDVKRGQMCPSVSRIVLGLLLIEWQSDARLISLKIGDIRSF